MKQKKIIIDETIYPKEAIYGAVYVFIDRLYIYLDQTENKKIELTFKAKEVLSDEDLEKLEGELMNELLNYTVRINLAKYNKEIRELLVGQALISAVGEEALDGKKSQDNSAEKFEYIDDPLGIAIPWEEKYGKKRK
jgi:His-Xaa-Ser system protein HxsD